MEKNSWVLIEVAAAGIHSFVQFAATSDKAAQMHGDAKHKGASSVHTTACNTLF